MYKKKPEQTNIYLLAIVLINKGEMSLEQDVRIKHNNVRNYTIKQGQLM